MKSMVSLIDLWSHLPSCRDFLVFKSGGLQELLDILIFILHHFWLKVNTNTRKSVSVQFDYIAFMQTAFNAVYWVCFHQPFSRKFLVLFSRFFLLIHSINRCQNFRLAQIETNCRQHFKVHFKWKVSTI